MTEISFKSRLLASIEVLRPINCIMGSLTVIIGILNTRGVSIEVLLFNIIIGILTYFFIAGSGMVINDIYDLPIDKVNRPERPIPRGDITVKHAWIIFTLTYAIGVLLSIIHSLVLNLGVLNVILAIFFGFIGWVYAKWGKKSGFPGNIVVSLSFSIGLIYGAVLNSSIIPIFIYFFFLTSFFLLLSREIIKGCEDLEGDREEGVKTLAIKLGTKKASYFSLGFAICAIIFFVLPVFTNIINRILFLVSMFFGLAVVILAVINIIKKNLVREDFKKISMFLKLGAYFGLISFVLASI